jgi:outer membrane protein assembly factor BamB
MAGGRGPGRVAILLAFAAALPALRASAQDSGPAVPPRPAAAEEAKALGRWIDDLDHRDPARREGATAALRGFGAAALPALRTAAASGSEETRARARLLILVLEAQESPAAVDPSSWGTLKGDMGRTGARGAAPAAQPSILASRVVGHGLGEGPDAPLACAEGVVVAAVGERVVVMDAATLEYRWEFGLGARVTASPVIAGGMIYIGTTRGLTALRLADRGEAWSMAAAYGVGAAPLAAGTTLYACMGDEAVVALDAATGARRWEFRCAVGRAAPVLAAGRVVVGTTHTRAVVALDAGTGVPAWRLEVDGRIAFAPAAVGDTVIVGDGGRRVRAVDAATGRVLWTRSVEGAFRGDGPAVSARTLLFSTTALETEAYDPATGRRLWRRWLGTRHLSSPVLAGGLALIGSRSRLVALDANNGDDAWKVDLDGEVSSPLVAGGVVYALSGGRVVAMR